MQPDIRGNILLVDDTPDNLRLLSTMLTEQGYEVRSVINGAMALMGVQAEPPDLILLDINMPQMNGYEVCQQLKAGDRTREIPVIFISALEDVLDKVKAFAVGGVDYITKPFQVEEVLVRIENQLTICRLRKQLQEQNAQLQQQMLELQELNSLKEEFLHAVSHDLRTPIMGTLLVLKNLHSKSGETVPISRSILSG
jgi:two-component system sensor histidine kinase/response regulator